MSELLGHESALVCLKAVRRDLVHRKRDPVHRNRDLVNETWCVLKLSHRFCRLTFSSIIDSIAATHLCVCVCVCVCVCACVRVCVRVGVRVKGLEQLFMGAEREREREREREGGRDGVCVCVYVYMFIDTCV